VPLSSPHKPKSDRGHRHVKKEVIALEKRKKKIRLILALGLLSLLFACRGNETPTATATNTSLQPSPTTTASPVPSATATQPATITPQATSTASEQTKFGPDNFPTGVDPLTGEFANDPYWLVRRPLSVKVQIFPRGQRPPMGVSQADIVYDYYQNNGLTRFHAIFYSNNAEQVGPIRSARLFDAQLVTMYKTALAFGGADRRILERFLNSDFSNRLITEGYGNCPPMCRVDPNGFNFLVTNTIDLTNYIVAKGIDNSTQTLDGMFFDVIIPAGGLPGKQIFMRYSISSYNRWDYDPTTGRYLRFQDTQEASNAAGEVFAPLTDKLTGQQIAADNIVVLFLPHDYAYRSHTGSSEIIDIQVDGSGKAFAMRDGQVFEAQWNRPTKDSVLYLTLPDGSLYPFKPGNTWFQVIGQSSTVANPQSDVWRFEFSIP
jgi:hypothetical protein